jgi:hypothetical protein
MQNTLIKFDTTRHDSGGIWAAGIAHRFAV